MRELDVIQRDLLVEGLEDYVGLWQVAKHVHRLYGSLPAERVRDVSLERLRPLILEGLIEPGLPAEGGNFSSWDEDAKTALDRIEFEWRRLGKDPNIWDICWFKNTEKGNALARTLHE